MNKSPFVKDIEIAGRTLHLEVNKLAPQASTSVVATYGETQVLVTVMIGDPKPMQDGGVPLTVDFVERLYAGGIIKGSRWVKREGRPTDDATLTGRLIDRSIRPLFPKDMTNEVQVVVTLLATDMANDHDVLALNATSVALAVSNIPWKGPVGAVKVGHISTPEENFVVNPLISEADFSDLELLVTSNKQGVIMIEAGAKQLPEKSMLEAVRIAQEENQKIIQAIEEIQKEKGMDKFPYTPVTLDTELLKEIEKEFGKEIEGYITISSPSTCANKSAIAEFKKVVAEKFADNQSKSQIPQMVDYLLRKYLRKHTLSTKTRADGRKLDEVRPVATEVGLLPRTHGSALFTRGLTQVLSVVTLASPSLEQWIETAEGMEEKGYIHHYNAPPYSNGETGRMGGTGRREIGHGALAEKALFAVIPDRKLFPYTIRVVSEVLSENGSSSMGSTCGSTLALMDAGVPILAPVAGVGMGIIAQSQDEYAILTDIRGEEDFYGNMDFKIAGTETGINAIQLDIKLSDEFGGLTLKMIEEIFAQSRVGRLEILEKMLATIPESRKNVSQYAPKVVTIQVPTDKIGEIIGPGGRNIKNIIATTKAQVDIEDTGIVTISAVDAEAVSKAANWISGMIREVQVGEEFEGEVKRILPFGAFVEILPGKEGLVHVSKMTAGFVSNPDEVVKIGDQVKVKVVEIDDMGRINLAMYWGPKDNEGQGQPEGDFSQGQQPREFGHGRFGGAGRPRTGGFGGGQRRGGMSSGRPGFGGPSRGTGFGGRSQGGRGGRRDF